MPGMHGPLGFTTGGCPAATPARPQQPPPKGAPWLPTAGHGRVDSTPTLAAGHFILHHQVDFSSCTPGRHLRLGLVTQQAPSRARSAGRSAVLGGKPQQGEFKAHPEAHTYIHTYMHAYFTSLQRSLGPAKGRRGEREGERGERSRSRTGYHTRQFGTASGTTQLEALAQSCVQAVHDSGS